MSLIVLDLNPAEWLGIGEIDGDRCGPIRRKGLIIEEYVFVLLFTFFSVLMEIEVKRVWDWKRFRYGLTVQCT